MMTTPDFLLGTWTYRSFLSNPDIDVDFDSLEFGRGNIRIDPAPLNVFSGLIYGDDWQLTLSGSSSYGNPVTVRFQGKGAVGGEKWIYDYEGYVVKPWPNGIAQVPAIVGTIVRTIPPFQRQRWHSPGWRRSPMDCRQTRLTHWNSKFHLQICADPKTQRRSV